jgi:hypothetical protein
MLRGILLSSLSQRRFVMSAKFGSSPEHGQQTMKSNGKAQHHHRKSSYAFIFALDMRNHSKWIEGTNRESFLRAFQ